MANITTSSSPVTVMNAKRKEVFSAFLNVMAEAYGTENIGIVGDSELVVNVGNSPTGEPMFASFSPTMKNYKDRKTAKNLIKAFDYESALAAFADKLAEREEKAEKAEKKKAEKIAKDKAKREKENSDNEMSEQDEEFFEEQAEISNEIDEITNE